jgi:hypothetical protein
MARGSQMSLAIRILTHSSHGHIQSGWRHSVIPALIPSSPHVWVSPWSLCGQLLHSGHLQPGLLWNLPFFLALTFRKEEFPFVQGLISFCLTPAIVLLVPEEEWTKPTSFSRNVCQVEFDFQNPWGFPPQSSDETHTVLVAFPAGNQQSGGPPSASSLPTTHLHSVECHFSHCK